MNLKRALAGGILAELLVAVLFAPVAAVYGTEGTPINVAVVVLSFIAPLVLALWVAKKVPTREIAHGALVGFIAFAFYEALIVLGPMIGRALGGNPPEGSQPPIYWVAHAMKILGGTTGGFIAMKRRGGARASVSSGVQGIQ